MPFIKAVRHHLWRCWQRFLRCFNPHNNSMPHTSISHASSESYDDMRWFGDASWTVMYRWVILRWYMMIYHITTVVSTCFKDYININVNHDMILIQMFYCSILFLFPVVSILDRRQSVRGRTTRSNTVLPTGTPAMRRNTENCWRFSTHPCGHPFGPLKPQGTCTIPWPSFNVLVNFVSSWPTTAAS